VQKELDGRIVTAQWFVLLSVGIALALTSSHAMAVVCAFFGLQGIVYNVQPVRSKDLAFLDVISESVNNAFRLCLGWLMVDSTTLPPGSIVVAFWCGGAFLMAAKRLSEYRQLSVSHGRDVLARYRVSFASYSEPSLAVSCLVYAMLSAVLLAIFLIKYRIEYICLMPGIIALFAFYYFIAMKSDSSAQKPERLFQEPWLMAAVVVVSLLFVVTTVLEIPVLRQFTEQQYISIR
jgi:4-hydroxybenzoate polyprenyltransferase